MIPPAFENPLFTGRSSVSSRCGEGEGDEGGTLLEVSVFGIIIIIIVILLSPSPLLYSRSRMAIEQFLGRTEEEIKDTVKSSWGGNST